LALAIFVSGVPAQDIDKGAAIIKVDPASRARIKFIENYWDFGSIPKGSGVYHGFALTNIGSDTLVITRVKPTCGCTAAPLSSDRVAPGDTAEISVSLNTRKLQGKVKKYVNVDCNDPVNPYYKITFDAFVDNPDQKIISDPLVADFGEFKNGKNAQITLTIMNKDSSSVDLLVVNKPPDNILITSFGKNRLSSEESTTFNLEITAELEPGPFASTVTLEAKGRPESRMSVPIKGTVIE